MTSNYNISVWIFRIYEIFGVDLSRSPNLKKFNHEQILLYKYLPMQVCVIQIDFDLYTKLSFYEYIFLLPLEFFCVILLKVYFEIFLNL